MILASRAWDDSQTGAFIGWTIVALLSVALAVFFVLPGPWKLRALSVGVALALLAGLLGWGTVLAPRQSVSAAYEGDDVRWSRLVPKEQRDGENAMEVSILTALSQTRAVVQRAEHVLVINPRTGRTVASFIPPYTRNLVVGRTVDGFVIQSDDRMHFYDADGKPLGDVHGGQLVARAPGTSVVLECRGTDCAAVGFDDLGEERWRSTGYDRTRTVPITDKMPAYQFDELAVVPSTVAVARADDKPASKTHTFDLLNPDTGKVVRSFSALHAGSALTRKGRAHTFAVQSDAADRCTVAVWNSDQPTRTEAETCEHPAAVTGDHLVFSGAKTSQVVDLANPASSSALSPPADDGEERPPVLSETGIGGTTVLRLKFDGPNAHWSGRAATGGKWGVNFSDRWTFETPGEVTSASVGEASVLVTSAVKPRNPWDRPGEDDREVSVIDLATGRLTGHIRIEKRLDSLVGLPDGSMLVAIEGGRLLRLGGAD